VKSIFFFILSFSLYTYVNATDSTKIELHFPFNKFNLTTTQANKLDSFINLFDSSNKILTGISVYGHTDQIGSNHYNDNLSLKRANAVAIFLKQHNINIELVNNLVGFGKRQLVTNLTDEKERALNRRVVIAFLYENKKQSVTIKKVEQKEEPISIGTPADPRPKYQKLADKIKDTTLKVGDNIELPYLLFVGGMHDFLQISYPYLDELFYVMRDNPTLEIEIQGHVCCTNEQDGLDFSTGRKNLSYARAKAVYDFLRKSGIDADRMSYKGYGHQFPITLERSEAEKTRNRRVEIKIIKR
jgi:outer membrane protein OmpA-like peptidoglycan-associated protein